MLYQSDFSLSLLEKCRKRLDNCRNAGAKGQCMSILGKLFGSSQGKKLRLIRELARYRIESDPAAPLMGFTPNMIDPLTDNQLMMLPEASIATIVESYIALVRQGQSPATALSHIDNFRSSSFGGAKTTTRSNLYDFIIERVRIEHSDGPPLDESFIDTATFASCKVFGMELPIPNRPKYSVITDFDISIFHIVIAKYTRRDGGFLYPWRLLAFDSRSDSFAFSFNLEVTPVSCCLGTHTAGGTHFNLGSADPDMTFEEFEEWAIPKLIAKIYGDQLLSPEEMHVFGVKVVADYLGSVGMNILTISKDPLEDPQIYAMKDGRTAALIVRVAAYPDKGALDEDEPQVSDLVDDCWDRDYDLYFASVGLANANARNDYERRALLRNGSFHVAFQGIEQVA